jgi:hypothetical protein
MCSGNSFQQMPRASLPGTSLLFYSLASFQISSFYVYVHFFYTPSSNPCTDGADASFVALSGDSELALRTAALSCVVSLARSSVALQSGGFFTIFLFLLPPSFGLRCNQSFELIFFI